MYGVDYMELEMIEYSKRVLIIDSKYYIEIFFKWGSEIESLDGYICYL